MSQIEMSDIEIGILNKLKKDLTKPLKREMKFHDN
jgi:DNA-binding Lrp family transcriptional regulator